MGKYSDSFRKNLNILLTPRGKKAWLKRELKISSSQIEGYLREKDPTSPTLETLEKFAETFGISLSELISASTLDPDYLEVGRVVRSHLRELALKEGEPWPPSLEFLARVLKDPG